MLKKLILENWKSFCYTSQGHNLRFYLKGISKDAKTQIMNFLSITKCFAKRAFQLGELLLLCQKKFQLDDNFDYDKIKDILIQEMEKIEIVYDKDYYKI